MKLIRNKVSSIVLINITNFEGNGSDGSNSFGKDFCFGLFFIIIFFLNNVNGHKMINAIAFLDLFITIILLFSLPISRELKGS